MKTMKRIDQIAAEIWGIDVNLLPTKIRKREVVEARQVLMNYRYNERNLTQKVAGKRYNRDHGTVNHATNKVNELNSSDKQFQAKFQLFNSKVL